MAQAEGKRGYDRGQAHGTRKIILEATAATALVGGALFGAYELLQSGLLKGGSDAPDSPPIPTSTGDMPSQTASTATEVLTDTPSPTEAPTPSIGFGTNPDGSISFRTETGEVLNVPAIDGLTAKLEDGKAVYRAIDGNPYGLNPEDYAGEFKPNVTTEQEQTGGIVLDSTVVSKMINDKLDTIPEQRDKWIVPLPLDITNLTPDQNVYIGFNKSNPVGVQVCKISFDGVLPATNIIPDSSGLRILNGNTFGWSYLDSLRSIDPYTATIVPGKEMHYLTIAGGLQGFNANQDLTSSFGAEVALSSSSIFVYLAASADWIDMDGSKILKTDNSPIFLAADPA